MLILVGYSTSDVQHAHKYHVHATVSAIERCQYCVGYENNLPIYVLTKPAGLAFAKLWGSLKYFD